MGSPSRTRVWGAPGRPRQPPEDRENRSENLLRFKGVSGVKAGLQGPPLIDETTTRFAGCSWWGWGALREAETPPKDPLSKKDRFSRRSAGRKNVILEMFTEDSRKSVIQGFQLYETEPFGLTIARPRSPTL